MSTSQHPPVPRTGFGFEGEDNGSFIAWVNTDPRRAPLRNDTINALQIALPVGFVWLVFISGHDQLVGAVIGAAAIGFVFFALGFVFSWAQMITARRRGPTVRSLRSKLGLALVDGAAIGTVALTVVTHGNPARGTDFAVALAAAVVAVLIVLGLERFAFDVPAASESGSRIEYR